ncbi:MAG: DUF5706 domain-containing protein [Sphingobacteriales bacterium JAD_PAG50586_3]|nr:MAG: DUF5706 domain-containing protein [Sphingobacteriales bacterium JAD_PAG50586_3]
MDTTLKYEEQLQKIFANINDWLKFAEAKNFGLLSFNAAVVFGFSQTNFENGSIIEKAGFYWFSPFAMLSFLVTLLALFPILSIVEETNWRVRFINYVSNIIKKEIEFENIYFYGYLKNLSAQTFEDVFLEKTNSEDAFTKIEKDLSGQIIYNSKITWQKYQLFKIATFIFVCGFIAFIIAMLIFNFQR